MNEDTTSDTSVHRPAEPAVLNDPLRNRGWRSRPPSARRWA
jgi:hypothetical protein